MKQYLLDTNICAFMFRGKYAIRKRLQQILRVLDIFCDNVDIVGIDDVIPTYAGEKTRLRKVGMPIDDFDLMIGATALFHDFVLVTENIKHLGHLQGVDIENWIERS